MELQPGCQRTNPLDQSVEMPDSVRLTPASRWAPGGTRQAVRRLWDCGDRVMPVCGAPGVGRTTLLQEGRSALRAGTAGHNALTNSVPSGKSMYHPLRPRGTR